MASQTCTQCKTLKPYSSFHKDKGRPSGHHPWCKTCRRASAINYRVKKSDLYQNTRLKTIYGITLDDYNLMLENQENNCKICSISFKKISSKHIHVDHCHDTGTVRGILCRDCNLLLGRSKDSITTLKSAINYLAESKGRIVTSQAK